MAQVHLTIPTTSYTTVIDPIIGGYKISFYWYPNNSTYVTLNPCLNYPSVTSVPNGSGGSNITIDYDDGNSPLIEDQPTKNKSTKRVT